MRLIGMLDSPFVRRTAVCLEHLQVHFQHEPVSVFSNFDQFRSINPLVKAPTLVCDDGTVLMDSTLILQYAEARLAGGRSLWNPDHGQLAHDYRGVGLAMVACEKSAQLIYEQNLRPPEARFAPWMKRVTGQLLAAYAALEQELNAHPRIYERDDRHASIFAAIAWQFSYSMLASILPAGNYPALVQHSDRLERSAQFRKYPPVGPGVPGPGRDTNAGA
jgi:glutathione S-transferase